MNTGGLAAKPAPSRKRRWLVRFLQGGAALLALLVGTLGWLSFVRHPLSRPVASSAEPTPPAWWETPPPLTDAEVSYAQYLSAVTWQLPRERWMEQWNVGGHQYGLFSVRYQAAFADYAFAALLLLENMGLGHWSSERRKREAWALDSYAAPLGQGGIRLAYYLPARAFIPAGQPGLDGWSLLWYQPWASGPGNAASLWQTTARRVVTIRTTSK